VTNKIGDSESKVPMTYQEGKISTISYKTTEGMLKKINKLNLNQLQSH
jgi:hypothetical protein